MAKRLTEQHLLTKKLRALEDYMTENKITLEWDGYHMVFMDNVSGEAGYIRDMESGEDCTETPHFTETKLVRED
jgi:hypothetical protein